jgi:hypothetical protein
MFSYRYVYDSWVRLDVIGLNVQHTRQEWELHGGF